MPEEKIIVSACRPWNSPDSAVRFHIPPEEQAAINYCLQSCPYADGECINCLGGQRPTRRAGRPAKVDPSSLHALLSQQVMPGDICNALGISRQTLRNYMKTLAADAG